MSDLRELAIRCGELEAEIERLRRERGKIARDFVDEARTSARYREALEAVDDILAPMHDCLRSPGDVAYILQRARQVIRAALGQPESHDSLDINPSCPECDNGVAPKGGDAGTTRYECPD